VPRPVIAKLNREIARYLRDPDAKTRWAPIGLDPRPTTPEEFDKLIADDMATFTRLARAGNIKAD
jgi:tripartite-type tricarboxylate transporter receptor subunit TctC